MVFFYWVRFRAMIQRQTGRKIKMVRYDNAGEHLSIAFQHDLTREGTVSQRTCPRTSNQNQVAERSNYSLLDSARANLAHSKLAPQFWGPAVLTAGYVSQFYPHPTIPNTTPYEQFYGEKPNIDHLRVFGCDAFAYNPHADKVHDRAQKMIFIGYPEEQKGYLLYDPATGITSTHQSVQFNEYGFGGRSDRDRILDIDVPANVDPHDDDYLPSDDDDTQNNPPAPDDEHDPTARLRRSQRKPKPRQFLHPMVQSNTIIEDALYPQGAGDQVPPNNNDVPFEQAADDPEDNVEPALPLDDDDNANGNVDDNDAEPLSAARSTTQPSPKPCRSISNRRHRHSSTRHSLKHKWPGRPSLRTYRHHLRDLLQARRVTRVASTLAESANAVEDILSSLPGVANRVEEQLSALQDLDDSGAATFLTDTYLPQEPPRHVHVCHQRSMAPSCYAHQGQLLILPRARGYSRHYRTSDTQNVIGP